MDIVITPEDAAGPSPRRWLFWSTLGWAVVIVIVSQLVQVLAVTTAILIDFFYFQRAFGHSGSFSQVVMTDMKRGDLLTGAIIVSDFASVLGILWIVARKKLLVRDYLALKPVRAPAMLKWAGILLAYIVLTSGAAMLFHVDFGGAVMGNLLTDSKWPWLFWIAVVIGSPAFEEGFFRGLLFRGFEASRLGTWGTIVLTALLWATLHIQYNFYGIAFIAGAGVLFGLARARTGSLLVPLALHAGMNFFETVVYSLYGA